MHKIWTVFLILCSITQIYKLDNSELSGFPFSKITFSMFCFLTVELVA